MLEQTEQFVKQIVDICSGKQIWVAYSGGIDSHVLLHVLATARQTTSPNISLHAIHVDHGLSQDSTLWSQHCEKIAHSLAVDFHTLKVTIKHQKDLGFEAAARKARYDALESFLPDDAVLLTAQHQNDQVETVLLQLFRGAGPKGLSAMAEESNYQSLKIVRPLLTVAKDEIDQYAQTNALNWLDDPSNDDRKINRNYLRHEILPEITKRWPSVAKTISRSAKHCEQADDLLLELARIDLESMGVTLEQACLPIADLMVLSRPRAINLLRYLLNELGLVLPSAIVIDRVFDELCVAQQDRNPVVSWQGGEIRRYQQKLFCMPSLQPHDDKSVIHCTNFDNQTLANGQKLIWQKAKQFGISRDLLVSNMTIRFRQGGERIRLRGHEHHQSLKHLFQQWSVPPWMRSRIPLIFIDDNLVAIARYGISDSIASVEGEATYLPTIK